MTIQDLLDMGYATDSEIVLHDYDDGELYQLNAEESREGCEKLIVLYFDGIYE